MFAIAAMTNRAGRGLPQALAVAICALFPALAQAEKTQYPLTLTNCGREVTFHHAPRRAVSVGQSGTETLYLLGLAPQVVGTGLWLGPVLPEFEEVNAGIDRLADNAPSFESILAKKPDLVTVQFQSQIGPEGVVATPEQFAELGIPVYTAPTDCADKDNSSEGDGVRHTAFTMDLIYQEIEELAAVFDVQERGAELIADLKAREAAARQKIAAGSGKLSAVFWFSSSTMDADPYLAGKNGAPAYIMSALGIRNVIESAEEWPTIGWETIAKADPTIIVAGEMSRRRYPADDIELKLKFLETDPVTRLMPAVQQGRIVVMDAQSMNPTIRTIEGIEALATAVEKLGLDR
jgi:iron complex transport system substrate-binding protein